MPITTTKIAKKSQNDVYVFEEMLVKESNNYNDMEHGYYDSELDRLEIFAVQLYFAPTTDEFWSVCVESGAQKTVQY